MDLSYKREVTVGSLVILAIVLFIVGTSWLSGRSLGGDSDDYWRLQFADVAGLKVSSVVRVSGVPAGKVESIKLLAPGKVQVAVSLDEVIVPKLDAAAQVAAVGFVGDAVVDFDPGQAAEPLPKDRVIIGTQAQGFTAMAERLGGRADSVLIGAQALLNQRTADDLHHTLTALQGTLKAAQRTMEVYGNPRQGPTAVLTETMQSLRQLSARMDSTLANPALARTLERTETLTTNLAAVTARFDSTLAAINRGQGTLGKFATDSSLYYSMHETSQSLKRLLDELTKNPGKVGVTVKLF